MRRIVQLAIIVTTAGSLLGAVARAQSNSGLVQFGSFSGNSYGPRPLPARGC
jgi:hypothetical protein